MTTRARQSTLSACTSGLAAGKRNTQLSRARLRLPDRALDATAPGAVGPARREKGGSSPDRRPGRARPARRHRRGEEAAPKRGAHRASREAPDGGAVAHEGGKRAQPTSLRSFWWRVFRVPALTKVRAAPRRVRTVPLDRSTAGSVCVPIPPPSTADFVSTAPVEPESRLLAVGLHSLGATMTRGISPANAAETGGVAKRNGVRLTIL